MWSSSADEFFSQASKDGDVIKWSDLLDFYINLVKVGLFVMERMRFYIVFTGEKQGIYFPTNSP